MFVLAQPAPTDAGVDAAPAPTDAAPTVDAAPPTDAAPAVPTARAPAEVTVRGRVINALGRPVRGATVASRASPRSRTPTATAATSRRPIGATLVIEPRATRSGSRTSPAPTLDDIVLLDDAQTATETIEVKGEAPSAAPGAAQLDRQELQRVPGTGGDVVRALTVMPGVVNMQVPLGYSGVVIRGSSPQD